MTSWLTGAVEASGDVAYDWRLSDNTVEWSENAAAVLGFSSVSEISRGERFFERLDRAALATWGGPLAMRGAQNPEGVEYRFKRGDGAYCWIQDRGQLLFDDDGKPSRLVGVMRVVTQQKDREVRLQRLACYDELTGYANRAGLREMLDEAIFDGVLHKRSGVYLAVGVDNLARINETFGYSAGDSVIVAVGDRLGAALDGKGTIGRVGGNQYGVLLPVCRESELADRAQDLLEAIRETLVDTEVGPVPVTVSLGAIAVPTGARNGREAMARAEDALAQAKRAGRDRVVNYVRSPAVVAGRRRNRELVEKVARAIETKGLKLAYQPIVRAPGGEIALYECLVRMIGEDGAAIPAATFMPVVEQLGLVRLVDRRALEIATEELAKTEALHLAVNVSGLTVSDSGWLDAAYGLLRHEPGIAERLTVEITETAALKDPDESACFVASLRDMGCRVALDDFGAGHSSFRQLKALAVNLLKIDGSFVRGVAESKDNQLLVRTLIDLARGFSLETVAEWVESTDDARFLVDQGVDYLQGYLLGAPLLERGWALGHQSATMPVITIPGLSPQHAAMARLTNEVSERGIAGL